MNTTRYYQSLYLSSVEQQAAAQTLAKKIDRFVLERLRGLSSVGYDVAAKAYSSPALYRVTPAMLGDQAWVMHYIMRVELLEDSIKLFVRCRGGKREDPLEEMTIPRSILHMSTWDYSKLVRSRIREYKTSLREELLQKKVQEQEEALKANRQRLVNLRSNKAYYQQELIRIEAALAAEGEVA